MTDHEKYYVYYTSIAPASEVLPERVLPPYRTDRPHVGIAGDGTVHIVLTPEIAKQVGIHLINAVGESTEPERPLEVITNWICHGLDKIHGKGWDGLTEEDRS
jgi:hypothetical protein